MAAKKVGTVIKEARTAAGLTQEQLARKVAGVTATELGKVERGEADFTQAKLKAVAKALGVTQATLLNAPKNISSSKPAAAMPSSASSAKTGTAGKTATPKTPANANSTMKVTAAERKLIEYYRTASGDAKKAGTKILKGECAELLDTINNKNSAANAVGDAVSGLLGGALNNLFGGKK
ncbi:MAG: helix-turn-helix transcriptional regulator [Clostridia bacterium]|nr:helix-turn-helix transcriptional regulator [Clostridia bacterium]